MNKLQKEAAEAAKEWQNKFVRSDRSTDAYKEGYLAHAAKSGDEFQKGFESRQPEVDALKEQLEAWQKQCLGLMDEIQSPRTNF